VTDRYTTVLFDLDHTLMDSDASEDLAFAHVMELAGVSEHEVHRPLYNDINRALWAAVERQEVTPDHVRLARFEQLVAAAGLTADPAAIADAFVIGLATYGELYPGVRSVLDQLAGRARLALVTNGLSEVQRTRIERLDLAHYFDAVVISAEVGASKPAPAIFDIAFGQLDWPAKATVLMVGDSLTSDIKGGADYGIATCWYNSSGRVASADDRVDHEISTLEQLVDVVSRGSDTTARR